MQLDTYEVEAAIIGGGAVGLACAAALARNGTETILLEAGAALGAETSARNSEVIHAGLYYPTGSLKHRLCVIGRRRLYPYLARHGVAHKKCGKLIVATNQAEIAQIESIAARAHANGVENMRLLSGAEARAIEPNLNATAALLSSETGVFDSHGYMLALRGEIEHWGGAVLTHAPVLRGAIEADGGFVLEIGGPNPARLRCKWLVNAAGLHAQAVARTLAGLDAQFIPDLILAKGSYFGCAGASAFTRLIYPAPVDGGLGVHLTLDLNGRMRFGPDVEWLDSSDPQTIDYRVDAARGDSFYAAIRRYWPSLKDDALTPDYSGCRPKLSGPGAPAADFRIDGAETHGQAGLVNLFGIESPGLTSSLAIAEMVLARLEGHAPSARLTPAIFFDRDGTLNHDDGYTHDAARLRWIDGAIEAVRSVNARGWKAIVVTNQAGIARGLFDEAAMRGFHARMQEELAAHGARIDAFYHCPFHEAATTPSLRIADHPDRKPSPGMLLRAMREHPIDPMRGLMIGNHQSDLEAGRAAGVDAALYEGGSLAVALERALDETNWARL